MFRFFGTSFRINKNGYLYSNSFFWLNQEPELTPSNTKSSNVDEIGASQCAAAAPAPQHCWFHG